MSRLRQLEKLPMEDWLYYNDSPAKPDHGNLIHWRSGRQSLIMKSSCEAELLATVMRGELSGILSLYLQECTSAPARIKISCDSAAAITMIPKDITKTPSMRTRHISARGLLFYDMLQWQDESELLAIKRSSCRVFDQGHDDQSADSESPQIH